MSEVFPILLATPQKLILRSCFSFNFQDFGKAMMENKLEYNLEVLDIRRSYTSSSTLSLDPTGLDFILGYLKETNWKETLKNIVMRFMDDPRRDIKHILKNHGFEAEVIYTDEDIDTFNF